ncbi:MAG TPA: response regulator [Patescibacteria group bacterium]|nr:response regulator [Patescibacteria group bacterium]
MMSQPCILMVESDPLIRFPVAEYLRDCGYRVVEVVSTDEAEAVLTQGGLKAHVVLAHVESIGKMDGFALARWMRENKPDVRVVLSATPERVTTEAGKLCSQGPAIEKPYHHQFVLERIKRELAERERQKHKQQNQAS